MNYRKGWKRAVSLLMTVVFLFYAAGYRNYSFATNGVTQSRTPAEINDFPAEYRAGLEAVKKAFPNAVFIKFDTGLDWSELFTSSSFFYPYRCTIPNSKNSSGAYNYPSSYKGIEFNNAFNFIENEWSVQEGGWTQASEALIRYYVDPRNFLSSEGIFSFLSTSYNEQVDTPENINAALKNTFMYDAKIEVPKDPDVYVVDSAGNVIDLSENTEETEDTKETEETEDTKESEETEIETEMLTYAEVFCLLAKKLGVSGLALANRVRLEQGTSGSSPLISGTYAGFEGYYNYFNMSATGANDEEIYRNGLTEAKKCGWDSRYKALLGGAAKYTTRYVNNGRNTPYLLKYNVVADRNGVVSYLPYMTAVFSPESEAKNTYRTFQTLGLINGADSTGKISDMAFQFIIPVYQNMPSEICQKPTGDGNPNYKLKGLAINNNQYSLGTFDVDKLSYSTVIPYASSSVVVQAAVFSTAATVEINGVSMGSGKSDVARSVDLNVGNNTVTVKVTAQTGTSRIYTINIFRQEKTEDDQEEDYSFSFSDVTLDQDNNRIHGVPVGMKVSDFLSGYVTATNAQVQILNQNGARAEESALVGNGQKIQVLYEDQVKAEYTIIVYGDTSGDGVINVMDIVRQKRQILGIADMTPLEFIAGDLNFDGIINVMDILAIKRDILGIAPVNQNPM